MTDELKLSASLQFIENGHVVEVGQSGLLIDVAGTKCIRNSQVVGLTEELLEAGDVALGGFLYATTRHATAVFKLLADTGETAFAEVQAGEVAVFRTSADATIYVLSSVDEAELDYVLVEA